MKNTHAKRLVDRITAINWQEEELSFTHGAYRAHLMREYLRRAAAWIRKLEKQASTPSFGTGHSGNWPFVDFARVVDPSVAPNSELAYRLDDFLAEYVSVPLAGKICRQALSWYSLLDESLSRFPDLPDPFDPLIIIFERGGGFWVENGFIDFVTHRVRLADWEQHLDRGPLASLDSEYLDSLDKDE
ncbi:MULTISPECIES: hypothetical protein [unclassified Streptomyces]|uniref:hypothetical protein n=1 Tax=unclassified Streptomyces TaxID=2593676 RepID=UPI0024A84CDC|nr:MULTISPECIES: hypothetical protein [unclassified Streptomyces]